MRPILALVLALGAAALLRPDVPEARRPKNPITQLSRDARDAKPIRGRVEQRIAAGSYTYLALRTEGDLQLIWAVTLGRGAARGTWVRVRSFGHRSQFYSRRLNRTFPELVFGIVSRIDRPTSHLNSETDRT